MKVFFRLALAAILGLLLAQPTLAQTRNAGDDGPYMTVNPAARLDSFARRAKHIIVKFRSELKQHTRFKPISGLVGRPDSVAEMLVALRADLDVGANYDDLTLRKRWAGIKEVARLINESLNTFGNGSVVDPKTGESYTLPKYQQERIRELEQLLVALHSLSPAHTSAEHSVANSPNLKAVAQKAEQIRRSYVNTLDGKEECVPGMEEKAPQMLLTDQIDLAKTTAAQAKRDRVIKLLTKMRGVYRKNVDVTDVGKKKQNLQQVDELIAELRKA